MARLIQRIEEQQPSARRVAPALHETVAVARRRRQLAEAGRAPIMVADQHDVGHLQRPHAVEEIAVGLHLAPMREIAGDDRNLRVGVMLVDVGDRSIEARPGIEPVEFEAGRDEMRIGDVNELHVLSAVPLSFGGYAYADTLGISVTGCRECAI